MRPIPSRATPTIGERTLPRTRLASTTSTAQMSVARAMSVSPRPHVMPSGGRIRACPATSTPRARTGARPSRSPRKGPAISATQMTIVLWMNAADGALAIASPVKNRRKATPPPRIPIRVSVSRSVRPIPRTSAGRTTAAASATRIATATRFLRVVKTAGSGTAFTADAFRKTAIPLIAAVPAARRRPIVRSRGSVMASAPSRRLSRSWW